MGVKRDNVPFAGVIEGTESPKNRAKQAKRCFAAVPDLLRLKPNKLQIHNCRSCQWRPVFIIKIKNGETAPTECHDKYNARQDAMQFVYTAR